MPSSEVRYEEWLRAHEARFSALKPSAKLPEYAIKIIGALAKALGRLAYTVEEDDQHRRFRTFERTMDELNATLTKIQEDEHDEAE